LLDTGAASRHEEEGNGTKRRERSDVRKEGRIVEGLDGRRGKGEEERNPSPA